MPVLVLPKNRRAVHFHPSFVCVCGRRFVLWTENNFSSVWAKCPKRRWWNQAQHSQDIRTDFNRDDFKRIGKLHEY